MMLSLQIVETMTNGIEIWSTITNVIEREGKRALKKSMKSKKFSDIIRSAAPFFSWLTGESDDRTSEPWGRQFDQDDEYIYEYDDYQDFEL